MFIVREDSRLSRPEVAGKVIKAQDFWAWKKAERAVQEALDKQREIIDSAQVAYQAEKQRGYAEGSENAKLHQSGNMLEITKQTVEYFGRIEGQMVDLVLEAVQKVVNDFDDRQRITTVVKNCLDLVRSQKQLTIRVHPSQFEFLRGQVGALQEVYPSIHHIDVHPDPKLATDACVVETEIGVVEASLAGQVEILRETLASVFEPHLPAAPVEEPSDETLDALFASAEASAEAADDSDDGDDSDEDDGDDDDDEEHEDHESEDDEDFKDSIDSEDEVDDFQDSGPTR